jgi:hypothetical protein
MKKQHIILGAALLSVSLAACGNNPGNDTNKTSTSAKSSSSSVNNTATKETKSTNSTTNSSTKNTSSTSKANETTAKSAPEKQAETVLEQLNQLYPQQGLPNAILTSKTDQFLTAATTSNQDQGNFRILYYAEKKAIPVNDPQVNQLSPIASFEKCTYGSADEAKAIVNQIADLSGQAVDLGYGITGYQQGAAGSSFLAWQEGNWHLVVRASTIEGEQAQPLAKSVVDLLEKEMLPAPKNAGQITLSTNEGTDIQQNSVIWQNDTVVYSIHHLDPIQSIKMATSI